MAQVIDQPRSTRRRVPKKPDDVARPTAAMVELATMCGRYGYGRITARLAGSRLGRETKRVKRDRGGARG